MSESTLHIHTLPALADNYIWLLANQDASVVVDPGDAQVVLTALEGLGLALQAILITHHHPDHIGGVAAIISQHPGVTLYVPRGSPLLAQCAVKAAVAVGHGDRLDLLDRRFEVIETPGHTRDHVAYVLPRGADQADVPRLWCGDTLFNAGCGRVFDGTVEQLWQSLQGFAALSQDTLVYCAHEYTESNLRFAYAVEPDNPALELFAQRCRKQRAQQQPTVPFVLGEQWQVNPFLRTRAAGVVRAAERYLAHTVDHETAVFAALRAWKNQF